MKTFNLTPNTLDKLKGDTILVKYSELQNFADYCKQNIRAKEELEKRVQELEEENKKLKRELNQKVLNEELGPDSKLVQLENENAKLKNELTKLQEKYNAMEKMYLEKLKDCSNKGLEKTISEVIRKEIQKLTEAPQTSFEISI